MPIDQSRDKSLYVIDALSALKRKGKTTFTSRDLMPHLPKDFWPPNYTMKKKFRSLGGYMKTMRKVGRITPVIRPGHKSPQKWSGLTVYEILNVRIDKAATPPLPEDAFLKQAVDLPDREPKQSEFLHQEPTDGVDWKRKYESLRSDLIAVRNMLQERLDRI